MTGREVKAEGGALDEMGGVLQVPIHQRESYMYVCIVYDICVITPCACARGKVIGCVVVVIVVVVVSTKIAISRDVDV